MNDIGRLYLLLWFCLTAGCFHAETSSQDSCNPCHCYHKESEDGKSSTFVADCSNLGLTEVPPLPENIEGADFSSNSFTSVQARMVQPFPSLKSITLRDNLMTRICDEEVNGLNLRELDLLGNNISMSSSSPCPVLLGKIRTLHLEVVALASDSLKPFPLLTQLNMVAHCEIPDGLYHPFLNIHSIYLKVVNAISLPDNLFDTTDMAKHLKSLTLDGPHLIIPDKKLFMNITRLRHIHLRLSVDSVPFDLFYESISGGHKNYRHFLQSVTIEGVAKLPSELFTYMPSLSKFKVSGMSQIPEDLFANTKRIQELTISDSHLVNIPSQLISSLSRLKHLNLSHNEIDSVDHDDLSATNHLQNLDLSYNHITSISEDSFEVFADSLQHLNLTRNPLCLTSDKIFANLRSLRTLRQNMSCVGSFDSILHGGMQQLQELYININEINTIPPEIFKVLPNLRKIILDSHKIFPVTHEQFQSLLNISVILSTGDYSRFANISFLTTNDEHFIITEEGNTLCTCQQVLIIPAGSDNPGGSVFCASRDVVPFATTGCSDEDSTKTTTTTTTRQTLSSGISWITTTATSRVTTKPKTKSTTVPKTTVAVDTNSTRDTSLGFQTSHVTIAPSTVTTKILLIPLPPVTRPNPVEETQRRPNAETSNTVPTFLIPTFTPRKHLPLPNPPNHSHPSPGVKVLYYVIPICALGFLIIVLFSVLHTVRKRKRRRAHIMRVQNQQQLYTNNPYLLLSPYPSPFVYSQSPTAYPRTPPVKYCRRELEFTA